MIEIVACVACAVLTGVVLFSAAVWLLSRADRYDAADDIRERNLVISRPSDVEGLGIIDGGWDD